MHQTFDVYVYCIHILHTYCIASCIRENNLWKKFDSRKDNLISFGCRCVLEYAHQIIVGLLKIFSLTLCRPENVFASLNKDGNCGIK